MCSMKCSSFLTVGRNRVMTFQRFFKPSFSTFYSPVNLWVYLCRAQKVFCVTPSCINNYYLSHAFSAFHSSSVLQKKRKTREEKKFKNIIQYKPKPKFPVLELWPGITAIELAKVANRSLSHVFEAMDYVENCEQYRKAKSAIFDREVLAGIAKKLGYRIQIVKAPDSVEETVEVPKDLCRRPPPDPKSLVKRPPVVTIMGHVDHGKTTLLDSLRNSSIVSQEHGGITQHIGAFTVKLPEGQITFLDTPGHAAFHAMRARGAQATDIVVLVVAADDGVMEQTLESVRFSVEANVPMIIAINKIDKPQANVEQVKKDLLGIGIQLEEYGGDVQAVCISALKKQNLDHLTDAILTLAEVMGIGGDPNGPVEGIILESSVSHGKGKLSTALVQRGVLRKGICIVAGTAWAKVRALFDEHGKKLNEVAPGIPAQITGWRSLPEAGDIMLQAESERHAQEVVTYRNSFKEEEKMEADSIIIKKKSEEHLQKYRQELRERLLKGRYRKGRATDMREKEIVLDTTPTLSVILKGDVHGSVEAVIDVMSTYKSHEICRLDLVHSAVGNVTESDVVLAETFEGIIYAFNVSVPSAVKKLADEKNVPVKTFNVIYHLIDDVKHELSSRLPPAVEVDVIGEATVLQVFMISEKKNKVPVAGCKCTKGILKKGSLCRVVRLDETIYEGHLVSLKHEKTDVETIKENTECGLRIEDPSVIFKEGDIIICLREKYVSQNTDWNPGF